MNRRNNVGHAIIGIIAILAALQDEGAKAKFIAGSAAGEDVFLGKAIAADIGIALSDSAVIAIIFAIVGKFDQSTDVDVISVIMMPDCTGFLE